MSFSINESLKEVQEEIRRLQTIEKALLEASGGEPIRASRVSPLGSEKIKAAARVSWAKRKNAPRSEIARLEQELARVDAEYQRGKAARRQR